MKKLLALAFFAFLMVPIVHPDFGGFASQYGGAFGTRMSGWYEMSSYAIVACLLASALVYMVGTAFQSAHLKQYAKGEMMQVTASTMMIFFAVALLYTITSGSALALMGDVLGNGASSVACAAAPDGRFKLWDDTTEFGAGPLGAFKCKTQDKITALDRAYGNVYTANFMIERLTSTCFTFFGVPVYCGDWDMALHKQVEESHLLAAKIVGLLMPLHAQYVLAQYVQNNMLSIFLPLGLVLRIFPFTRGVGGLFIAIAVGFFFVWPTFFLLTDPTFVRAEEKLPSMQQGVCYTGFKGSAVVLQTVLNSNTGGGGSEEALAVENGKLLVYQLSISILFYPFVALAITLIFVRAMTPLLGGDLGELMKMVARLG